MTTFPLKNISSLQEAIDLVGPYKLADECGIKGPSVYKWLANGYLPRTEWTGETAYTDVIVRMVAAAGGTISREQLMQRPNKSTERVA